MPPDQKKPFTDVNSMMNTKYDGFDYRDYLAEFLGQVDQSLPTGLEFLALFIKGKMDPIEMKL